jgi:hypothetical protein
MWDRNVVTKREAEENRARVEEAKVKGDASDATVKEHTAADRWAERLVKFIPAEVLGLYLALENIVRGQSGLSVNANRIWLTIVLIVSAVFGWVYLGRIWKVRPRQRVVSLGALVVYVFALGGVFATLGWYEVWYGTIALVIAGAFLALSDFPDSPAPAR